MGLVSTVAAAEGQEAEARRTTPRDKTGKVNPQDLKTAQADRLFNLVTPTYSNVLANGVLRASGDCCAAKNLEQ
jgi:hypothetical protein